MIISLLIIVIIICGMILLATNSIISDNGTSLKKRSENSKQKISSTDTDQQNKSKVEDPYISEPATTSVKYIDYPYGQPEEGVWFFTGCDTILHRSDINKTMARNINTIYFSALNTNNCGWGNPSTVSSYVDFISYAHSKGMNVFAVTMEDPKYITQTYHELKDTFGSFINKTKRIFDTYMIDVEPQDIKGADPKVYLPQYVNMSKSLRHIADQYGVKYIDTVPTWYHAEMKKAGIKKGLDALSSHSINLMDYFNTTKKVLNDISDIRSEVTKPYVVSIKITRGLGATQLEGQEIPKTIGALKASSIPMGLFEVEGVLKLPKKLFP
jgi:hypothetical protein